MHADEDEQLMSLDASGRPVPVPKPEPAKNKPSSSNSPSVPSQKNKSTASGNKSTAASQKAGSSKAAEHRPSPIDIPSGITRSLDHSHSSMHADKVVWHRYPPRTLNLVLSQTQITICLLMLIVHSCRPRPGRQPQPTPRQAPDLPSLCPPRSRPLGV